MDKKQAQYLLQKIRQDYNKIAKDFSRTRDVMWSDLEPFIEYSTAGDKVLDLGCGNGRLYPYLKKKQVDYVGIDNSEELIKIAKQRCLEGNFQLADGLKLPFSDAYFNKVYAIAVLHHIPSKELRLKFLQEVKRTLKLNGLLILTVWKLNQKLSRKLIFKYTALKLAGLSRLDFGDVLVPWGKKTKRYVHNFSEKGLKKLVKKAGLKTERIGTLWRAEKKNANIYVVARK